MLLYISVPHLLPDVAPVKSQIEATRETIAPPVAPVKPKLSMVWHKEFDGKRERMVAHWIIDAVGREC